jgi:hypothetical protein
VGAWTRKGLNFDDLKRLPLTPEEGFVLSRLDVPLDSGEVSALTGLAPERAQQILARLAELGAITEPPDSRGTSEKSESERAAEEEAPEEDSPEIEKYEEPAAVDEASYRKIYETTFRNATQDARLAAAQRARGAELMALCLDPDPEVLLAVLGNPSCALQHARYAARWHPTGGGLEAIGQRASFMGDAQVQRLLLRNTHLTEALIRRILGSKRMLDAYKASVDTDIPERTRQFARAVLRTKFGTCQGEERAGVICTTEGRVLAALAGLSLDGRATSILCARSYTSALFVQSLARFGACPPQLLAHLLKQPIVKRQHHLKAMLLQHPNMSAEAKRRL